MNIQTGYVIGVEDFSKITPFIEAGDILAIGDWGNAVVIRTLTWYDNVPGNSAASGVDEALNLLGVKFNRVRKFYHSEGDGDRYALETQERELIVTDNNTMRKFRLLDESIVVNAGGYEWYREKDVLDALNQAGGRG